MSTDRLHASYDVFRDYATPALKQKHIRWFDRECWRPAACESNHRMLEIGCGTGQFLLYLRQKGVSALSGLDVDEKLVRVLPETLRGDVHITDAAEFLRQAACNDERYDRVFMLDVFEHFTVAEGMALLVAVAAVLAPGGRLVIRVPNLSSPWGAQHQFSDLTHKAAYTPKSLEQIAVAAGYDCLTTLGQRRGSRFRRVAENLIHRFLSATLSEPPEIWSANFIAVLAPRDAA